MLEFLLKNMVDAMKSREVIIIIDKQRLDERRALEIILNTSLSVFISKNR